jgi:uncharacterized protein YjeT (DUF2065 family)
MSILETIALAVVVLAGLYLLALGVASLAAPTLANRFLLGFAGSQSVHYAELLVRFVVGVAFVFYAPRMFLSVAFNGFGLILLVTTTALLLVPWPWHHRFAQQAVPRATRHIRFIGIASLAVGGLILAAVVHGSAA